MNSKIVMGVDIGGTHITAALVDIEKGQLVADTWIRRTVRSDRSATNIVDAWCEVIEETSRHSPDKSKKIGIAMPGPFDYDQGISLMENQGKFDALYGLNIKKMISNRLSINDENIRFVNDAGSFISGEVAGGIAKGYELAVGLTLGTGLGTATFKKGEAADAALWSTTFRGGIAEDYFSTRWFIEKYLNLSGTRVHGVKDLMEIAGTEPIVKVIFEEFGSNLAEFLISFIRAEQPQIVVLGGNIANAYELFSGALNEELEAHNIKVVLKKALLGEGATLIGAASTWKNAHIISANNK